MQYNKQRYLMKKNYIPTLLLILEDSLFTIYSPLIADALERTEVTLERAKGHLQLILHFENRNACLSFSPRTHKK